ncbi:MAG: IspD/TarI family cytidylyltransferase, partial [Allosphingosinicella sp.]
MLVAAGSGSRAGGVPKQYRRLGGRPLLAHAIEGLRQPRIDQIQIVIGAGQEEACRDAVGALPLPAPVIGGATRQESVRNGLAALAGTGVERVLIHDAARPFLPAAVIDRLLDALETSPGAVPVLPVVDTLARRADPARLGEPVARDALLRVQTPQAFRYDEIVGAHQAWRGGE